MEQPQPPTPTKKCKACQKEIDPKAKICPYCRTKQTSKAVKVISGIVTIVVVLGVVGALFGGSKSTTTTTQSSTTPAESVKSVQGAETAQPTAAAKPLPVVVGATALVSEYDKNKLAAQEKYTGKIVQTTAIIENISSDIMGSYYLSLKPSDDKYYMGTTIQCYFQDKKTLTPLSKDQSVTISGTMQDMSLGIIVMKDCSLIK
jgi:hypothetical protein